MPAKSKKLTIKEAKFVKAVAEGKSNTQAALEATGATSVNSAKTLGHRLSKKVNVQEALDKILAKHNINIDTAIAPIGKGLVAIKMNEFTGEITEDIKLQLSASDRALKLMGIGQDKDTFSAKYVQIINEKGSKYND